jgi:hypothetical protein
MIKDKSNNKSASPNTNAQNGSSVGNASIGDINIHTGESKSGFAKFIIFPSIVAIIGAITGAYANHKLALMRAPEKTVEQADTLLGIANSAVIEAKNTNSSATLVAKLEELISQAQALQATAQLTQNPVNGVISFQPDFWLPQHKGAILGGNTPISVNGYDQNRSFISGVFNNSSYILSPGQFAKYQNNNGKNCTITYLGQSPDGKLSGFKNIC